jgi:hypothetical protein
MQQPWEALPQPEWERPEQNYQKQLMLKCRICWFSQVITNVTETRGWGYEFEEFHTTGRSHTELNYMLSLNGYDHTRYIYTQIVV